MAHVQFLTGPRAEEFIELNPSATLIAGSAAECHIQIQDSEVAPSHCQIYPAEGAYWLQDLGTGGITILNMRRLAGETEGLRPNDVFILGRTFFKFWAAKPATPSGLGVDTDALEASQREIAALKEEVDRLRAWGGKGEELTEGLREALAKGKQRLEELGDRLAEKDAQVAELEQAKQEGEQLRNKLRSELDSVQSSLEVAQRELDVLRDESGRSVEELKELRDAVNRQQDELSKTRKVHETARVDAKRLQVELGIVEAKAQEQLQQAQADAEAQIAELESTLESTMAALEGARAALEAMGVQRPSEDLGGGSSELVQLIDDLGLHRDDRDQLEELLLERIDQESLRRFAGPQLVYERPEELQRRSEEVATLRWRAERLSTELGMGADPGRVR